MASPGTTQDEHAGLRELLAAMWSSVAPAWGENAERIDTRDAAVTAAMLDVAALRAGDRVLELACGPGGVGLAAAERVGPGGAVVMTDASEEMVRIAGERSAARGLAGVVARTCDMAAIDEPDASFDAVLCREGLMLVPDPVRAVAEAARVLRPGGRAVVAVWGPRAANPWLGLLFDAVTAQTGMPVPPDGVPGPFSLDDAGRLAGVLADGGLAEVAVEQVPVPFAASSFDEWWEVVPALAGPLAGVLAGLPDGVRAGIRTDAAASLVPFAVDGGGYEIPGVSLVGCGVAPSS